MLGRAVFSCWLFVVLSSQVGCYTPTATVTRPKNPEEFNVPPVDDARFSSPIAFPKEVMNKEPTKKDSSSPTPGGMPRGPSRMGAGGAGGGSPMY